MIEVVTPPAAEIVSLVEVKAHLRIVVPDDDVWLASRITAAREYLEHETGLSFGAQTLLMRLSAFANEIPLQRSPIGNVLGITYRDTANAVQTVPPSSYYLDRSGMVPAIRLAPNAAWPTVGEQAGSIEITYESGAWPVRPEVAAQFIVALVGTMYENREADAERAVERLPFVDRLIDRLRLPRA